MKTIKTIFFLVFVISLLISGCQASQEQTPSIPIPEVSKTSVPTEAPGPASAPLAATDTPSPTDTSTATLPPSPSPTATSTPTITPTFSPLTLSFAPNEPVKIGYLLWETDSIGIDSKRAIEIALQGFGSDFFGHPIELVGYNEECSELGGQRGAELLMLDRGVVGIVGTTCSRAATRAARVVSDAGRVMISPSNTSPEFTDPESRQVGYFRTVPNDIYQSNAVARFAFQELGRRKMASIYASSARTQDARSELLCRVFADLGGECVLERSLEGGTTYMTPTANLIAASEADVVYITLGTKEAVALVTEIRNTPGLEEMPVFVWELQNSSEFIKEAGEGAVGVYVSTTPLEFDRESGDYQLFLEKYQEIYQEVPLTDFHAYAYDATNLLLNAIALAAVPDEAGALKIDPLRVREALYILTDFPCLTGSLTCSEYGDCARVTEGRIYQFVDGDWTTFNPGPAASLSSNPAQVWP